MSTCEHRLDCCCGQALEWVARATVAHCPRCGRTVRPGHGLEAWERTGPLPAWLWVDSAA
jgi:hypothetical protein